MSLGNTLKEKGLVTPFFWKIINIVTFPTNEARECFENFSKWPHKVVMDVYVIIWFFILLFLPYLYSKYEDVWFIFVFLAIYRLIDFSSFYLRFISDKHHSGFVSRTLIIAFLNYCQIIMGFSVFYLAQNTFPENVGTFDAHFYSLKNMLTFGSINFVDKTFHASHVISAIQGLLGTFFLITVIAFIIASHKKSGPSSTKAA